MGILKVVKRQLGIKTPALDDKICDTINMAVADLAVPGIVLPGKTVRAESDGQCTVTVTAATFLSVHPAIGKTILEYRNSTWNEDGEAVTLSTLGLTVTGTPATGECITIMVDMPETDGNVTMAVSCYCLWALGAEENRDRMWETYCGKKRELRMKTGYTDWGDDE